MTSWNETARPSLRVIAVGDLLLGDTPISVGYGFASRYAGSMGAVLEGVAPWLRKGDVVIGNLESVLSREGLRPYDWHSLQIRGFPGYARELRDAGFTVLNVANNHALQHGRAAFDETIDLLRGAGISPCGLRGTDGWSAEPVIVERDGLRLGILGYCLRPRQYARETVPPYAEGDSVLMREDVLRLSRQVDQVFVSLHWGQDFVAQPSEQESSLARSLIDAGAILVLGHHPQVIRPIERYGPGIIAHSLGTFVSDIVWRPEMRQGAAIECEVTSTGLRDIRAGTVDVGDDFVPTPGKDLPLIDYVTALPEARYAEEGARVGSAQRRSAYLHFVRNLHRVPNRVLREIVRTTLGNKLSALTSSKN